MGLFDGVPDWIKRATAGALELPTEGQYSGTPASEAGTPNQTATRTETAPPVNPNTPISGPLYANWPTALGNAGITPMVAAGLGLGVALLIVLVARR